MRGWNKLYYQAEDIGGPTADFNAVPKAPEAPMPAIGGGGGSLGATLESRLREPIHEMGPEEAADTGGVADDPTAIIPVPNPEVMGPGNIDLDSGSEALIDLSDPSIPDAGPAHDMG